MLCFAWDRVIWYCTVLHCDGVTLWCSTLSLSLICPLPPSRRLRRVAVLGTRPTDDVIVSYLVDDDVVVLLLLFLAQSITIDAHLSA